MIVVETERLVLRHFHGFDGEAMMEGYSHPDHVYAVANPSRET